MLLRAGGSTHTTAWQGGGAKVTGLTSASRAGPFNGQGFTAGIRGTKHSRDCLGGCKGCCGHPVGVDDLAVGIGCEDLLPQEVHKAKAMCELMDPGVVIKAVHLTGLGAGEVDVCSWKSGLRFQSDLELSAGFS